MFDHNHHILDFSYRANTKKHYTSVMVLVKLLPLFCNDVIDYCSERCASKTDFFSYLTKIVDFQRGKFVYIFKKNTTALNSNGLFLC